MITNKTKEKFIKDMKDRIELRNIILDFYNNVFLPMLCLKFNGKVYNNRLINELNKEAQKIAPTLYVKEEYSYGEIRICMRKEHFPYNDYESLLIIIVTNDEGKIDYDASIQDTYAVALLKSFKHGIDVLQTTIDNYDKYVKVVEQLENALNEYNNLPSTFRQNINKDYLRIF